MIRSYKTLFELTMVHNFYTNGVSNDFVFVPIKKTASDVKNYKLLTKLHRAENGQPESYKLTTSYVEVDGAPLIPITGTANPSLVFGLKLHNGKFWNFTKETANLQSGEIFHFTNVGAADVGGVIKLVRTECKLKRKTFPYSYQFSGAFPKTITVEILDFTSGTPIAGYTQSTTIEDGNYQALLDFQGLDDGLYKVRLLEGATTIATNNYYVNDELALKGVFGVVDIQVSDNTSLASKQLQVNFESRETLWKYFVVFNTPLDVGDTIDVGQTPLAGLKFNEVTVFTGPTRVEDKATKESLEARYPAGEVRMYESVGLVEFKEAAKKDIKLTKNAPALPLIKHMPAPPLESPKAEAYIFI